MAANETHNETDALVSLVRHLPQELRNRIYHDMFTVDDQTCAIHAYHEPTARLRADERSSSRFAHVCYG
jgi:cytosine/adenosine deaminase-related metal-dependent hydrolase